MPDIHPRSHVPSSAITLHRSRIVLPSQVAYDVAQIVEDGGVKPRQLGSGRFAKVFAAQQIIAGQPSRCVAIKVLHDTADYQDERLFSQEVALNREFAAGPTIGVAPILDVIHLGPLVLCGCGVLYHPTCPQGCGEPLQRGNLKSRPFPSLRCRKCDYELSAEFVNQRRAELYSPRAKPCCTHEGDPHANTGTVVNFVLREVMVMEVLEKSLADFAAVEEPDAHPRPDPGALDRVRHYFGIEPIRTRTLRIYQKVRLLAKVDLMVQIAETVAWLHGTKQVVHKDLAPDNVMIRHAPCSGHVAFAGEPVTELLDRAANLCTEICVIDFGLADKEKLTRSWYEDAETSLACTKLPYLSPEARHHQQSIGAALELDVAQRRFRIPAALEQSNASIRPADILADKHDVAHAHDLFVSRIEEEGGHRYAYFDGNPPKAASRRLDIIRPLGEAHDVYALGAMLYYILTGRHDQVEHLSNLVGSIQDQPCALDRRSLARRDNYANRRHGIREPFWRDELMLVILRAMVRGRPESFVSDRMIRGPEPAQRFLAELKRIQHGLIAEIFRERDHARTTLVRGVVVGVGLLAAAALLFGAFTPRTADARAPESAASTAE